MFKKNYQQNNMGFSDGPIIVTNGLVLSLDAADKNSYPGSGTAWNDLSGNANSGSLVASPTFSNVRGGNLTFNGTSQYASGSQSISFPTGSQALTIEAWVNVQETGIGTIFGYGIDTSGNRVELGIRASNYVVVAIANSAYGFAEADNLNSWIHLVAIPGTLNSQTIMYKNGVQKSVVLQSGTDLTRNISTVTRYFVGNGPDPTGAPGATFYLSGSVATVKLYNRALSATEIAQNYDAQKSRFGL